jgi:CheY-like chemotaxis protein
VELIKSEAPDVYKISKSKTDRNSILIIDDSVDLLELQKQILEIEGFEILTAQSGLEAFKVLSEIDQPALILLDVRMGDMSGPHFLLKLEEEMPEITNAVPIVFITAMNMIPPGKVVGFIRKPFDVNCYLEAIHRFIDLGLPSALKH